MSASGIGPRNTDQTQRAESHVAPGVNEKKEEHAPRRAYSLGAVTPKEGETKAVASREFRQKLIRVRRHQPTHTGLPGTFADFASNPNDKPD